MEFTASQIASFIGGVVSGDENVSVNTLAKIEEGHAGALSFIDNPKYEKYLYTTESSIIIVNEDLEISGQPKSTLVKVKNARQGFTMLLHQVSGSALEALKGIDESASISSEANIGNGVYVGEHTSIKSGVSIGEGAKIFPQVYLDENVKIGKGSILYPGVKVYRDCVIGDNCVIHSGTIVGSDGFGFVPDENGKYTKVPQIGNVVIGNDVEIGSNCTIDRASMGSTVIEDGAKLDNLIQVAHNVVIGKNTVIAAQTGISGSTKLGNGCVIGGQVGIVGHIDIANGTQINAQSGVAKAITVEGKAWTGSPAREFRQAYKSLAYLNRLPELQSEVKRLQKEIEQLKQK